jgi:hypothetical protein
MMDSNTQAFSISSQNGRLKRSMEGMAACRRSTDDDAKHLRSVVLKVLYPREEF